jgi:acetylornithine/succinyldiaminopimelate/putrescine aminotransferase
VKSLSIEGSVLYSYQTPIAVRKDNLIYTCNRHYSPTTSRQQGEIRRAAGDQLRDVSTTEFIKIVLEVGANYLGRLREQKLIDLLNEQLRS